MNYGELRGNQKGLDDTILKSVFGQQFVTQADHKAFTTEGLFSIMVELSETAAAKTREEILGESIDTLHFILNTQNTLELEVVNGATEIKDMLGLIPNIITGISLNKLFVNLFIYIGRLANATRCFKYWSRKDSEPKEVLEPLYLDVITGWLCLMKKFGFTAEEIEQAYLKKNQINYQRQESGY